MYYAYILKNEKGVLYKGSTKDLKKRLLEHTSRKFDNYTRRNGSWKLVYFEQFESRIEAEKREKYFKTGKGRGFIKRKIKEVSRSQKLQ